MLVSGSAWSDLAQGSVPALKTVEPPVKFRASASITPSSPKVGDEVTIECVVTSPESIATDHLHLTLTLSLAAPSTIEHELVRPNGTVASPTGASKSGPSWAGESVLEQPLILRTRFLAVQCGEMVGRFQYQYRTEAGTAVGYETVLQTCIKESPPHTPADTTAATVEPQEQPESGEPQATVMKRPPLSVTPHEPKPNPCGCVEASPGNGRRRR